jgi:hypothetical protein
MCPVLPSAMAMDQAHQQATIKGSRYHLGQKYDQNPNKN